MEKIRIEELQIAIEAELQQYTQEVADQIKKEVRSTARECVREIKEKAPENTGGYKKGWKFKVLYEDKGNIRMIVYNSRKPGLSHLLEFGHVKRNGKRIEGAAHIYPAEQNAKKRLEGKAKLAVRRK